MRTGGEETEWKGGERITEREGERKMERNAFNDTRQADAQSICCSLELFSYNPERSGHHSDAASQKEERALNQSGEDSLVWRHVPGLLCRAQYLFVCQHTFVVSVFLSRTMLSLFASCVLAVFIAV